MMGMLEGLRAGGADARAAQELAMRQEADRRAAELHAANLDQMGLQRQQLGLQLNRARAIEDAQNNLSGLVKRERENQDFLASGNAGPVNPVTERDFNSAQMGLATAKGDLKELDTQRGLRKKMDVADEAKRLAADPAFQQKALSFIGDSEHFPVKVVKGKRDPKTGQLMTADTLEFDTGYKHTLKDGDVQRIAYGAALHNLGMPEEATKVFSQVNKELSAAVNTANDRVLKGYDFSSKAEDRVADNNRADQMLRLRYSEVNGHRPREMPPAMLKELSDIEQKWIQADPKDRPVLERQYQMALSRAGASVGRPMGLPTNKPPADVKVNADGSVTTGDGRLFVPDTKQPSGYRQVNLGPSALDQAIEAKKNGQGQPQRSAPAAAPAAPRPKLGERPPDAVSAAEGNVDAARRRLSTFGLRQRSQDPGAFAAAQQALRDAEAQYEAAFDQWSGTGLRRPAFTYPTP